MLRSLSTQVRHTLRRLEVGTRAVHPETARALAERRASVPPGIQGPAQLLGRHTLGCEGTQGVFPACNFTCTPCYHSADANKVRVDGAHTVREVTAQMQLLRRVHGRTGHAQLIGGEVSLLPPDAHAEALLAMRAAGREPMSMTHGDFDESYLRALVTGADGRLRLRRVSFAVHMDSLMRGRRGIPRPRSEGELGEARAAFVAMLRRLRRELGLRFYVAHNMTVTPQNLGEVSEVVRQVTGMGYHMLSFQPAASVGDPRRWSDGMTTVSIQDVWTRIETGVGHRVPWQALQFGHPQCNRTAMGLQVNGRWVPWLEPEDQTDLALRDLILNVAAGIRLNDGTPALVAMRLARLAVRHPALVVAAGRWAQRLVARSGGMRTLLVAAARGRVHPLTIVVHSFMDAQLVRRAWTATQAGETSDDAEVAIAQERLAGCFYTMAHPQDGSLVPACVQHSVLDPEQNRRLRVELPMPSRRQGCGEATRRVTGA